MFYVGQKVVCVDDAVTSSRRGWFSAPNVKPTIGKVYTVRAVGESVEGFLGLRLHELNLCGKRGDGLFFIDNFYRASRFRPVVERKTDISIFKKILISQKEPA